MFEQETGREQTSMSFATVGIRMQSKMSVRD